MFGCVYKIINLIDGKIYVGRYQYGHYPSFDNYWGSGTYIKRAIAKYGLENFKKEILEEVESNEILNAREVFWILELKSADLAIGYNLSTGGDCPEFTEEAKCRVSEAKKGKCPSKYKGVPRSEEVRQRISEGRKGINTITPEIREKMLEGIRERKEAGLAKHSEETIEKIRQKKIERDKERTEPIVVSEDARRKMSAFQKGRKHGAMSEKTKQKLSENKKGKPWSEARRGAQKKKVASKEK